MGNELSNSVHKGTPLAHNLGVICLKIASYLFKIHFIFFRPSPRFPKCSLTLEFPIKIVYTFLNSPIRFANLLSMKCTRVLVIHI
jgi:hypothetical protein